ncbi:MAG TPA: 3D domain-containing protein, partial [Longimicrobiales bacterium]|nr:3D domain-containing protein [Longimicrobiales bacterium]
VLAYFRSHPEDRATYLHRNPRYIFFREEKNPDWPAGSLNVPVTPLRSLATDKALFPPGGVVLVATRVAGADGRARWVERLLVDQDAGRAIESAGRADIYYGVGAEAGERAGRQYSEGQLYYLFIKPDLVDSWQGWESVSRP